MHTIRRTEKAALLAIVLFLILVAHPVTGSGTTEESTGAPGEEVVTIEFWHIFSGQLGERIEGLLGEFEEENPGIAVEPVYVPYNAMLQSILSSVAAGDPPPIAQLELTLMARLASEGALMPIADAVDQETLESLDERIIKSVHQANSYDDTLYTIPMGYNSNVLYYNPELLEAAGIDPERQLPTTWEELVEIAPRLTVDDNGDGTPEIYGYGFPARAPWILEVRFWQAGAELFNDAGTGAVFDSRQGRSVIEGYRELLASGGAIMISTDTALNELSDMFGSGRVALFEQSSTAFFGIDDKASFEVGVAQFPTMGEEVFSMGGYNLGVFENVPRDEQEAALDLALWWSQPEVAARWTAMSNYMPGISAAWQTDTLQAWREEDPRRAQAARQLPDARPRPSLPAYPEIAQLIADAFESSVRGQANPQDALDDAAEEANNILDE
jgi:sn-glycerol 3-phosphate transport system substrate-binding protein